LISEEELRKSVNAHVANLLAEQVYRRLKEDLQIQWNNVISELAATRKTSEHMKKALIESQAQLARMETLLNQKEAELQQNRLAQQKASEILDEALKELGVGE